MKYFIVLAVVAFVAVQAQTDKQKELLAKHHKECQEKTSVSQEVLQKARTGDFQKDPKLEEHIFCISKKTGFQNEAGTLQKPVIEKKLKEALKGDEAATQKLIAACVVSDPDPKKTAVNAFKCIHQKASINLL